MSDQATAQKFDIMSAEGITPVRHATYMINEDAPHYRALDRARRRARRLSTKDKNTIVYVEAKDTTGITIGAEGYANGRLDTREGAGFK